MKNIIKVKINHKKLLDLSIGTWSMLLLMESFKLLISIIERKLVIWWNLQSEGTTTILHKNWDCHLDRVLWLLKDQIFSFYLAGKSLGHYIFSLYSVSLYGCMKHITIMPGSFSLLRLYQLELICIRFDSSMKKSFIWLITIFLSTC